MNILKIEELDNNYRVKITVNRIRKTFRREKILSLKFGNDIVVVKVLSCDIKNKTIECKKFNPCIYIWTTASYQKSNIYKVGITNWQSVKNRIRQQDTTGVLEPIEIIDYFKLSIYDPKITEMMESEIHNTIGKVRKDREAVRGDYKTVIKPVIINIINKYNNANGIDLDIPTPRYYQQDAADTAAEYYKNNDKGWIQWTCGSGKSFGGYWIYKSVVKSIGISSNVVIILVPNKQLVTDTYKNWNFITSSYGDKIRSLRVCDEFNIQSDTIVRWLSTATSDTINLIVSTYQSSSKVADALRFSKITADFLINDEVHRLTGPLTKSWSKCLYDSFLPVRKRLSMTASPIEYTMQSVGYSGMENKSLYGEKFHQYLFLDAQLDGNIAPLEVLGVYMSNDDLQGIKNLLKNNKDIIQSNLYSKDLDFTYLDELIQIDKGNPTFFIQLHNTLSCLRDKEFSHPIIYANSTKRIEMFMACLKAMAPLYNVKIDYSEIFTAKDKIETRIIDLEKKFATAKVAVVGNVYCLQEGISINEVDSVIMIDPRSSAPSIIQILGRPVRLNGADINKVAKILLPLIVDFDESGKVIIDNSCFDDVKDWIINICGADSDFQNILTDIKIFTSKSKTGTEIRNVLQKQKKTSISGKNISIDKKERQLLHIDFNEVMYNMEIKSIISSKKSTHIINNTKIGLETKLNHNANDYILKYREKIITHLNNFNKKQIHRYRDLIKLKEEYISDFSQTFDISIEKSTELLTKYKIDELVLNAEELRDKMIMESL
jgi:superfamily II DNA or RNA helicase